MEIALRNYHVRRKSAVHAGADRAPFRAEIRLTTPAKAALSTEVEVGLGRDPVAGREGRDPGAGRRYLPCQPMAEDDGRPGGVLVMIDVQVGAADTGCPHGQERLSRTGSRYRHLAQVDLTFPSCRLHDRLHGCHADVLIRLYGEARRAIVAARKVCLQTTWARDALSRRWPALPG